MACRVREPCVRQPGGGEQESHALYACVAAAALFSAAGAAAGERMDAKARVERANSTRGAARGDLAAALARRVSQALAAIDAEIPGGRALRASNKPREV